MTSRGLLLVLLCLLSCKKTIESKLEPAFVINNVHELVLPVGDTASMVLEVKGLSNLQERINLSVYGLPAGVYGSFSSESGIISFSTTLKFEAKADVPSGDYPITISGENATGGAREYNIVLHVFGGNSFKVGTTTYLPKEVHREVKASQFYIRSSDLDGNDVFIDFLGGFPTSDAEYKIVSSLAAADEVTISAAIFSFQIPTIKYINNYYSSGVGNKKAKVTLSQGKIRIEAQDIPVIGPEGPTSLSCDILED